MYDEAECDNAMQRFRSVRAKWIATTSNYTNTASDAASDKQAIMTG